MTSSIRSRGRLSLPLRILAALVFAAQGAVALAPVWEPQQQGRLRMHVEQEGNRHLGPHDDATCTVCAVRLVHAAPAERAILVLRESPIQSAVAVDDRVAPSRTLGSANSTRAPPPLVA